MTEQRKYQLAIVEKLSILWCRVMHDAPMWPIHGSYPCRICGRSYLVPWATEHLREQLVIQPDGRVVESRA